MKNTVLQEELTVELASLDIVDQTIQEIVSTHTKELNRIEKAAIMSLLVQLYGGCENIFKRVCKFHHIPLPHGDTSHQHLAHYFSETDNRPFPQLPIFILTPQLCNLQPYGDFVMPQFMVIHICLKLKV